MGAGTQQGTQGQLTLWPEVSLATLLAAHMPRLVACAMHFSTAFMRIAFSPPTGTSSPPAATHSVPRARGALRATATAAAAARLANACLARRQQMGHLGRDVILEIDIRVGLFRLQPPEGTIISPRRLFLAATRGRGARCDGSKVTESAGWWFRNSAAQVTG